MAASKPRSGTSNYENYRFVSEFRNTHPSVWCPKFYILHQGAGCPYTCSYCYLRVLLCSGPKMRPRWYSNIEDLVHEIRFWMEQHKEPCSLNAGSVTDALAVSSSYLDGLIPLFSSQKTHNLNVLSKAGIHTTEALKPLAHEPSDSVSFSWTINCDAVSSRYERRAPTPFQRLKLAQLYKNCGWSIRYRIDPIFPIDGWEKHYREFIKNLVEKWARPDVITIGSIRAYPALKGVIRGEPYNLMEEYRDVMEYDPDFRHYRLISELRAEMYAMLVQTLNSEYGTSIPHIALCKETLDMNSQIFTELPKFCNCTRIDSSSNLPFRR